MKVLCRPSSALMYTKIYLRLEPLRLELVAQAIRQAGHAICLIDLQVRDSSGLFCAPSYLAARCRGLLLQLSGERARNCRSGQTHERHTAGEFCVRLAAIAPRLLRSSSWSMAQERSECILKGEGEAFVPELLQAIEHDRTAIARVPGVVSRFRFRAASSFRRKP